MSQAKVDRYKEEKRNREKIIKKQKREWMATKAGLSLVALVMVVWVGFSVYQGFQSSDDTAAEVPTYTVDTSALTDYMSSLTAEAE
ncbi:MAG: hypothetical protein SOX32_01480 [Candidatus Choladocola sp.]|nr:hypothetical protein [Candidatus Choladocola sp.]